MFTPRSTLFFSAKTMFMFYHIVVNGKKEDKTTRKDLIIFFFFKIQANLQSRLFSLGCPPVLVEPRKENINIKHNKQTIKTKNTTEKQQQKEEVENTTYKQRPSKIKEYFHLNLGSKLLHSLPALSVLTSDDR